MIWEIATWHRERMIGYVSVGLSFSAGLSLVFERHPSIVGFLPGPAWARYSSSGNCGL
ncbi:hypothetical protein BJX64DRAFT_251993 [Aspergillus heterothallicus]